MKTELERAIQLRERDMRARLLADGAVAKAMHELQDDGSDCDGPYREYAHRVAQLAASLLVSAIYTNDNEIAEMKRQRDHYESRALDALRSCPPRLTIPAI